MSHCRCVVDTGRGPLWQTRGFLDEAEDLAPTAAAAMEHESEVWQMLQLMPVNPEVHVEQGFRLAGIDTLSAGAT